MANLSIYFHTNLEEASDKRYIRRKLQSGGAPLFHFFEKSIIHFYVSWFGLLIVDICAKEVHIQERKKSESNDPGCLIVQLYCCTVIPAVLAI